MSAVQPTQFINYISQFKKCFVTRNNGVLTQVFKLDSEISDTYYFQFVNSRNQIVSLSGRTFNIFGSWTDAKAQLHLLFETDNGTVDTENNILSFRINTYTDEYLKIIKTTKECNITIVETTGGDTQVVLRDKCLCYKRPVQQDLEPTPIIPGFGLQLNGYILNVVSSVLSGDNSTIAINDNVISYIGEAENTYTAGEGIGISDQNVISLTATIPLSTSQLVNDSDYIAYVSSPDSSLDIKYFSPDGVQIKVASGFINNYATTAWVEGKNYLTAVPDTYALKTDIPLSTSQLVNDSDFITSSALTGISTDKLQKIVIDSTVQDSGFVMQYDPTADVVYNTIITDNGVLTLNVVSGFENDIEVGKVATFENWIKPDGALTGVAVGQGLNLIGEIPSGFTEEYTQVFSRRIARINADVTVQQISYNYEFFEPAVSLTLRSNGSTTVTLIAVGSPDSITLSSRVNDNAWTAYSVGDTITLSDGDEVSFKGTNDHFSKDSNNRYEFSVTGEGTIEVYGSLKSLAGEESTLTNYAFNKLFRECTKVTDASKLVLPKTGLSNYCFRNMFYGCTSLTAVPEIRATQLPEGACSFMYSGCTALTSSPDLHAVIMGKSACQNMFAYDTALVKAPAIPATTLSGQDVCKEMFRNCSSLTSVPDLSATTVSDSCFNQMFRGCSSLSTAPYLPAITLAGGCYRQMFEQCSSLIEAPKLSAVNLASYCYYEMFKNCSSLSSISVKFTSWGSLNQTTNWVYGVAANGVFTKPYELSEESGSSRIPSGWNAEIDDYSKAPITFKAVNDSVSIQLYNDSDPGTVSLQYNKNGAGWTTVTVNDPISLDAGDTISFRGNNTTGFNNGVDSPYKFTASGDGRLKVYGNIMSLLDNSTFSTRTDFNFLNNSSYVFLQLFQFLGHLIDASKLVLPATTLTNNCYQYMFQFCTALTGAPELPATTLAQECYDYMFAMCTSLSTAPELPATELVQYSYRGMFQGCESLSSISVAFTDWKDYIQATDQWVDGVAANGTFYCPTDLDTTTRGYSTVPSTWLVENI